MSEVIIKKCGCGRDYTEAEWLKLVFVFLNFDGVNTIESRHCTCGSTISIDVGSGNQVGARMKRLGLSHNKLNEKVTEDGHVIVRVM